MVGGTLGTQGSTQYFLRLPCAKLRGHNSQTGIGLVCQAGDVTCVTIPTQIRWGDSDLHSTCSSFYRIILQSASRMGELIGSLHDERGAHVVI